ncbi:MAG: hypothetical protein HQK55_16595 [Deltaproteobacteria bacterium]|nr:hypothetical protein [Deltaproteobacteria bacterium]
MSTHTEEDLGRVCLAAAEEVTGSKFGFLGEITKDGQLDGLAVSDPGWEACEMTALAGRHQVPKKLKIKGILG